MNSWVMGMWPNSGQWTPREFLWDFWERIACLKRRCIRGKSSLLKYVIKSAYDAWKCYSHPVAMRGSLLTCWTNQSRNMDVGPWRGSSTAEGTNHGYCLPLVLLSCKNLNGLIVVSDKKWVNMPLLVGFSRTCSWKPSSRHSLHI